MDCGRGNVLGYVAISAQGNPDLIETTSREGFQVTPHYQNFVDLLSEFVRFAGDSQEYLRRGVLEFIKQHRDRRAGVEPEDSHGEITKRIDDIAESLTSERIRVEGRMGPLRGGTAKAVKSLDDLRMEVNRGTVGRTNVTAVIADLEDQLRVVSGAAEETEKMLVEISSVLDRASELKAMREVLDRRWESLRGEVSALYESVSLGLTAEALAHEIHNIADRLAREELRHSSTSQGWRAEAIDCHVHRTCSVKYRCDAKATVPPDPFPPVLARAKRTNRCPCVDTAARQLSQREAAMQGSPGGGDRRALRGIRTYHEQGESWPRYLIIYCSMRNTGLSKPCAVASWRRERS